MRQELKDLIAKTIDNLGARILADCDQHYNQFIFKPRPGAAAPYDAYIHGWGKEDYELMRALRYELDKYEDEAEDEDDIPYLEYVDRCKRME